MFERFTDRARRVLVLAQEESKSLGHNFIGTEHVLLGLAAEGEGVGYVALGTLGIDAVAIRREIETRIPQKSRRPIVAEALATVGIDLEQVRREVDATFGEGALSLGNRPPFTPRAKTALEASMTEATALGHSYIGTEHLLLGLTRGTEGLAVDVLARLGTDTAEVRRVVLGVLTAGTQLGDEPVLQDLRALESAVRFLPEDRRTDARAVLHTVLYPVRGAANAALATGSASPEEVRVQVGLIEAARDETLRRLDELGVGSFVKWARLILEHPSSAAMRNLGGAVSSLAAALRHERFSPEQVSIAVGIERRASNSRTPCGNACGRSASPPTKRSSSAFYSMPTTKPLSLCISSTRSPPRRFAASTNRKRTKWPRREPFERGGACALHPPRKVPMWRRT